MILNIKKANTSDFASIRAIAYASWPVAYGEILSEKQLQWMLAKFYSDESLQKNIEDNHQFFIVTENEIAIGFVGIEHGFQGEITTRLHKIYLHPSAFGKNVGRYLLDFVASQAQENGNVKISLNVNKYNTAIGFYKKLNFAVVGEEIIPIGNGYVMDDFRMEKII